MNFFKRDESPAIKAARRRDFQARVKATRELDRHQQILEAFKKVDRQLVRDRVRGT